MSVELKIKSKHLGLEAGVIRFEEHKIKKQMRWKSKTQQPIDHEIYQLNNLKNHRRWDVRNENRATFLARAYIAGIPYKALEAKRKPENESRFKNNVLPRVAAMVSKYDKKHYKYTSTKEARDAHRKVVQKVIERWIEE